MSSRFFAVRHDPKTKLREEQRDGISRSFSTGNGLPTSSSRPVGRLFGVLLLSTFAAACAHAPPPRPAPEPRQAHHSKERPVREQPVLHVAPPPAYGNKVVLAEVTTDDGVL